MKVKVISRNPEDYIRGSTNEINRIPRNLDPDLHPFEAAREYTKALNAAKLDRIFAKPFVASLDGHSDGVNCLIRNPRQISSIASGACDGQVSFYFDFFSMLYCYNTVIRSLNAFQFKKGFGNNFNCIGVCVT